MTRSHPCIRAWTTALAWYVIGLAVLSSPLGAHPDFPYNWESYTAWHVFGSWVDRFKPSDVFALTDGLMTDSGRGPLVGAPIWLGFQLGDVGLATMRLSVMLVAALAVPLTWLVGRRLVGNAAASLATILLAISPVWLLYGRTATLVGVSLVPALLTVAVLLRVLEGGRRRMLWLAVLQVLLVAGAYAYAPIRFLWPLSLGLIALELVRGPSRRWRLWALAVTLIVLPASLAGIVWTTAPDASVVEEVTGYYNARGEQILALNEHPQNYAYYLTGDGGAQGSPRELAWRLIHENTADLGRLLLDEDTAPALTHYYNPKNQPVGRLYPRILAPVLVLGLVTCLWNGCARGRRESLVLLAMAGGFTIPMLLTSRVHIGRLIFALPFLLMMVAAGAMTLRGLPRAVTGTTRTRPEFGPALSTLLSIAACVVLVAAMWLSLREEERLSVAPGQDAQVARKLEELADSRQANRGVALVTAETSLDFEAIAVASYRLMLDSRYHFIDLSSGSGTDGLQSPSDQILVYFGELLDRLDPDKIPRFCSNVYLVAPSAEERFLAAMQDQSAICERPIQHERLPE